MRNSNLIVAAVVAIGAVAGIGAASAADLPARTFTKAPAMVDPAYNWSGWYVGGNVGYSWGDNSDPGASVVDPPLPPPFAGPLGLAPFFGPGGNIIPSVQQKGVIGGVQAGYNWMFSPTIVGGLVADFQGSGMMASAANTVTRPGFDTVNQSNKVATDWFGTVRGKLGFAQNNVLFYGTGGLAYGQVRSSGQFVYPFTTLTGSNTDTKVGWAAGAGIDYGFASHWSIGAEYLYVNLGRASYTEFAPAFPANTITISNRAAANIVRATLNYKF